MRLVPLDPNLIADADGNVERRERLARSAALTRVSLAEARLVRDQKMQQALDHAESETARWGDRALAYLRRYAERHDRFPGWFVTKAADLTGAVPTPPTPKAWGAIFTKAARVGWIVKNGYTQDPHRHANPCPVWKSLIWREGCSGSSV